MDDLELSKTPDHLYLLQNLRITAKIFIASLSFWLRLDSPLGESGARSPRESHRADFASLKGVALASQ
jgi:hypothetical protein